MALSLNFVYSLGGGNTSDNDVAFLLEIKDQRKTERRISSEDN